jgi:tetratricopeptide (TPR) repeat protein
MDWKLHKLICKTLKKLPYQLQPYQDVLQIIQETHIEKQKNRHLEIRVLDHIIAYAEHQFGDRVEGLAYRERENGNRMDNWEAEIRILFPIYKSLVSVYINDLSLSLIARDDLIFPYYEKMLDLLRPWSASIDLNSTSLRDNLTGDKINHILMTSSSTECSIALIYLHRNQFDLAENYCQRALSHARLYEGKEEVKTKVLCQALRVYGSLQSNQGNLADAVASAEEAYNCAAVAYNPVHPEVQKAAGTLIECLTHKGDMYNAERFAQATLDSLKDPANKVDRQSEEVARGYHNLAEVISQQEHGDLVKAEMLARESLRIRTWIFHNNHSRVGISIGLLGNILQSQGNLGNETKELFERSLAIYTKSDGPDGLNTAASNINVGIFYEKKAGSQQTTEAKKEYLHLSQSKYKEAMRIYRKVFGPDDPRTIRASSALSALSIILRKLSES